MTAKKISASLTARYLDLLADEGYRPQIASDDDGPTIIRFKAEGEPFLLFVEERDPHFFHVGSAYELGDVDPGAAVSRANDLNEELKGVKVGIWMPDQSVRLHVETFIDEAPVSVGVLERSIGAIRNAASRFFQPARAPDQLDA